MTASLPPEPDFPRYSARPLPPYRFVHGVTPHPTQDPRGHSFGLEALDLSAEALAFERGEWRRCPHYCYGVDLYNHAYWWEAHETWEGLWRCFDQGAPLKHALQALIQIAAAHYQRHRGLLDAARRVVQRAGEHVAAAQHGGDPAGGVTLLPWWERRVVPYFTLDGQPFPYLRPE